MTTYRKDPAAVLDYAFDWTAWCAQGETIDTSAVTITGGSVDLIIDSHSNTDAVVTAWVSAGSVGTSSRVTCHIETNQGRIDERTVNISVVER